ncbi:MAG: DUF1598 domain-containing protein, partial [Thermoguttaceae bacterium]|nr:DUF1598 domain-containing protein [Thermoguttaceae bacterium]
MCRSKIAFRAWAVTFCLVFTVSLAGQVYGQMSSGGGSYGGSSGGMSGGNSGGRSGGMSGSSNSSSNNSNSNSNSSGSGGGGVMIQADGVLQRSLMDRGAVDRARMEAAYKGIASDMRTPSLCRKVSLTRLEKKIAQANGVVSDDMANLAGLLKIENVFVYPETGDVVIAGPAEGWVPVAEGTNIGYKSGRPTLQLVDLVVALRAYAPANKPTPMVGCSIDPTEAGLKNMQTYLRTAQTPNIADDIQLVGYAKGIRESLGLQNVSFWGVSPKTHFAATMAAADYRMKLIGIGLEQPPVRMTTYVDKANPISMARNSLARWFFQPDYDCVVMTEDMLGMKILGDGVKLVGEDELVSHEGKRQTTSGSGNRATKLYAKSFTDKYSAIARLV